MFAVGHSVLVHMTSHFEENKASGGWELSLDVPLTCNLSQAADEQRLVVTGPEGDAVTQPVIVDVFDLMLSLSIHHTQQVLLQQFRTTQH